MRFQKLLPSLLALGALVAPVLAAPEVNDSLSVSSDSNQGPTQNEEKHDYSPHPSDLLYLRSPKLKLGSLGKGGGSSKPPSSPLKSPKSPKQPPKPSKNSAAPVLSSAPPKASTNSAASIASSASTPAKSAKSSIESAVTTAKSTGSVTNSASSSTKSISSSAASSCKVALQTHKPGKKLLSNKQKRHHLVQKRATKTVNLNGVEKGESGDVLQTFGLDSCIGIAAVGTDGTKAMAHIAPGLGGQAAYNRFRDLALTLPGVSVMASCPRPGQANPPATAAALETFCKGILGQMDSDFPQSANARAQVRPLTDPKTAGQMIIDANNAITMAACSVTNR